MTPDLQPFVISRTFDAPRDLVWKAHTQCEHLRHWWGPKGFKITDCKIDLRPGGTFLYGMQPVSGGDKIWGKFVYREIDEPEKLVFVVSFSDENAGITRHPMSSVWPLEIFGTSTFSEENGKTTVTVSWKPFNATEEEIDAFEAGRPSMMQGFGGTFDQFEEYLKTFD